MSDEQYGSTPDGAGYGLLGGRLFREPAPGLPHQVVLGHVLVLLRRHAEAVGAGARRWRSTSTWTRPTRPCRTSPSCARTIPGASIGAVSTGARPILAWRSSHRERRPETAGPRRNDMRATGAGSTGSATPMRHASRCGGGGPWASGHGGGLVGWGGVGKRGTARPARGRRRGVCRGLRAPAAPPPRPPGTLAVVPPPVGHGRGGGARMQAQRVGTGGSRGAHIWITRGGVVCAGLAGAADLAALWAAFAVKSGEVCGQSGSAAHSTCQPVSLLYAFDNPMARGVLALMVSLGLLPLAGRPRPARLAAARLPGVAVHPAGAGLWILLVLAPHVGTHRGCGGAAEPPGPAWRLGWWGRGAVRPALRVCSRAVGRASYARFG